MPPEIETPVQTPETPVRDGRPGYTAPNTSHLDGLTLPDATEADEDEEVKDAAAGVRLPKTLKDSLAMLSEAQGMQPKNKAEAALREGVMERLRAHIHALSQGPTCKPITAGGHVALARVSGDHAEDIHLTLLCRTDRIVANRLAEAAATSDDLREQVAALTPKAT